MFLQHHGAAAAQAQASTIIALDTFTDADSTLITAHIPDVGPMWEQFVRPDTGTATDTDIVNNRLRLNGNENGIVVEAGQSDVRIEVDWTPAVGVDNRNSIVFRYRNATEYWILNFREPNGDIQLSRIFSPSSQVVASVAAIWTEGVTYSIRLETNGSSIVGYVNNVPVINANDMAYIDGTKHGLLRNAGDAATLLDNFRIVLP